ncbi:MAG: peptidoglycan DD-metalloendopeptidase family protein [Fimbriimonadaceae bacterium]|nr:peptidoglycan DD-metalloendopeptidase family protein [Fimbriimonadaceae bacterium]
MKKTTLNRIAGLICVVLMTAGMIGFTQSSSSLKKKQSSLSSSLSKVKQKRNQLRSQLNQKKAAVHTAMDQVHAVDSQLTSLNERIDNTTTELNKNKKEQQKLAVELREQTEKLDVVKKHVAQRVRAMYVQGETAPIAMIAESKSVGDLAARKAFIQRIANSDRELFNDVRVLRDAVLAKKKQQDLTVARIAELVQQQKQEVGELQAARAKKKQLFAALKAEENELEVRLEEMERESNKLEAQIAAIQARTSGSTPIYNGKFIRPVNGRMSSGFGSRVHPITGKRKTHTGIDIAASSGTPIKAAGSGKVITASYINGYGNTIVIDHGGGISTLYGHCSRLYAKVGQSVKTGERIAAVGSTGFSTGPHLHFEVRVNGKPVNPIGRIN